MPRQPIHIENRRLSMGAHEYHLPIGSTVLGVAALRGDPVIFYAAPEGQKLTTPRKFVTLADGRGYLPEIFGFIGTTETYVRTVHVFEDLTP